MAGVMPLAATLLMAVESFNGGVQVDVKLMKAQPAQLPEALPQSGHQVHQAVGLIDTQAVHIAPIGAGHRQPVEVEKTAQQAIEPHVGKMPQPIEPDKQQHQYTGHHAPVAHGRTTAWGTIEFMKHLIELKKVQKFYQCQKAAKGAQLLTARVVGRGSTDFTGPGVAVRKSFTVMRFSGRKILLFNHLGELPCVRVTSPKPL